MSSIEQLDQLVQTAREAGIVVRHEYFGGTGGGLCHVAGKSVLFIDLALSSADQLERVREIMIEENILPARQRRAS